MPIYSTAAQIPLRVSKGSLAGPIGPARYLLLDWGHGQQKLENVTENVAESLRVFPALFSWRCALIIVGYHGNGFRGKYGCTAET